MRAPHRSAVRPAGLIALVVTVVGGHFLLPDYDCAPECDCDPVERLMTCSGPNHHTVPSRLPVNIDSLTMKNCSQLYTIPKHAFRKLDILREIRFIHCDRLQTIEKFAFKGLRRLKLISFSGCPSLTELVKGAFSSINNDEGLRILFANSPIRTVHGGAFRHAQRLRAVSIAGVELHLQRHAFASINTLDFLTLSGVAKIDPSAFTNSTRFHVVDIYASTFDIQPEAFSNLAFVHQLLIQRSRLPSVATEAFSGIATLELLELYDNDIGILSPHAFSGVENVGRIKLARNRIASMQSPDAVAQGDAVHLLVTDNVVRCSCDLKWMGAHTDTYLVDGNYCGNEGAHRTVRSFLSFACYGAQDLNSSMTVTNQIQKRPDSSCFESVSSPLIICLLAKITVLLL